MKPIQIGLLVVVGAIGGALVMRVVQEPADLAVTAKSQAPAAPAAAPSTGLDLPPLQPEPPKLPAEAAEAPAARRPVKPHKPAVTVKVESTSTPPEAKPQPEPVREAVSAPPAETTPPPPARPEPEPVIPAPRPPEPHVVTLKAGMLLPVRMVDGLSSERNTVGDTFTGTLDKELVVDGFVIAERGARVEGKVVAADRGGKVKGVAALAVELTRLRTSDGQNIAIQTDSFERHAKESHKQDAAKVGGGAALGAIIGAIAGGGKGAAVGAAAGGAAGAGGVLLTRGEPATLPSETRINFRLQAPVTVTEKIGGAL